MTVRWRREERLMRKLVGTGSKSGAAPLSRVGDVCSQPQAWAAFAAALTLSGPRGRRAALRGVMCSACASLLHLPIKRAFGRPRPRGARVIGGIGPLTSSFPSGHTASDLSFTLGASQELPLLLAPLSVATLTSHWSLIRSCKHYPSDVIGGGVLAVVVTAAAWKLCPPRDPAGQPKAVDVASRRERPGRLGAVKRSAMRFVTNRFSWQTLTPAKVRAHGRYEDDDPTPACPSLVMVLTVMRTYSVLASSRAAAAWCRVCGSLSAPAASSTTNELVPGKRWFCQFAAVPGGQRIRRKGTPAMRA